MSIDEQIEYLEQRSQEDLELLSPKDRLWYYANIKEFQTPKRQRTSINQNDSELPDDIYTD